MSRSSHRHTLPATAHVAIMALMILVALVCAASTAAAAYAPSADSMRVHIEVLASDSLEGREVGEPGEMKAADYIISVYEAAGLKPIGDHGTYLQSFEFIKRIENGPKNALTVNGVALEVGEGFLPLHQSADTTFAFDEIIDVGYGITTADSSYNDYADKSVAGKAVLVRRYAPESEAPANPHDTGQARDTTFDRVSAITSKIIQALDNDAAGVFFITPSQHDDTIISMGVTRVAPKDIPIVLLRRAGLEKLGLDIDNPALTSISGQTDLVRVRDTGYNVIGVLPGETEQTTIIGAHYDHLGWGTPSSRYRGEERKIHYGADDNGSGTAALLELAREFALRNKPLHRSVMFAAFSGEEAGLLGSSHLVRHWPIPRENAYMMINMDMIGRLRNQDKGLMVMGTGTSTEFKEFFDGFEDESLKMTFTESGAGPSDHAAFYNDSVPVLNFFTGAHQDYHTPDDTPDKLDYDGIVSVTNMISQILLHFDERPGALAFERTKDVGRGRHRSSFSVTLGIMPDYMSEVTGLRIDGVSPDRPADNAGMLKGDVIIRMGELTIGDIYDYMNALGKFRKGDVVDARVVRDTDTLTLSVEFK